MEEKNKSVNESVRDKVLSEWAKGNVCVRTVDGIMVQPLSWFEQQPIDGILYDMNRDGATILTLLDDPKWVNDYCLSKMLEHFYEENVRLRRLLSENGIPFK